MNSILVEKEIRPDKILQLVHGDITIEEVDAIVNAANEHLAHGGRVAWAILKKGGDVIQKESDEWVRQYGPVSHAHPAWTSGGRLPAKYIIHTVGPVWGDGDEDKKLQEAVSGSLITADKLNCRSVSMPAISTGIFGFPKDRAAGIIFKAITSHFETNADTGLRRVRVVLFEAPTVDAFLSAWKIIFQ